MQLRIVGGPQHGQLVHVQQEVVRVGSHPSVDVPLAGVAPHALTLQQRDGQVALIARCEGMRLAGRVLRLGESAGWGRGQTLEVTPEVSLQTTLVEPPPVHGGWGVDDPATDQLEVADDTQVQAAAQASNSTLKLTLCGLCVVLAGLMLVDVATSAPRGEAPLAGFAVLVTDLARYPQNAGFRGLREQLQQAHYHQVRGQRDAAIDRFSAIRDDLLHRQTTGGKPLEELEQRIFQFVKEQLSDLRPAPQVNFIE